MGPVPGHVAPRHGVPVVEKSFELAPHEPAAELRARVAKGDGVLDMIFEDRASRLSRLNPMRMLP